MSSRRIRFALAIMLVLGLVATSIAVAAGRHHGGGGKGEKDSQFTAHLIGYNEVPSLNSAGQADLSLDVVTVGSTTTLTYELTYSGFSAPPAVAHVHVGQPGVSGGVSFYLCGGGTKPACPASGTKITGSVVATDILGPTAQGFAVGDINAVVAAIRAGFTYANIHTATFANGEIRGQLEQGHGHDGPDDVD